MCMTFCLPFLKGITSVQCLQRPEGGTKSSETGVTYSCVLACGCYQSNCGPQQEQKVHLDTEPPLKPHYLNVFKMYYN